MLWRHRPTLVGALVLAAATAQAQPDPETIIRGGDVFVEGGVRAADVRIVGAVITEVGSALEPRDATTRIVDADGLLVLPGGIDPHVHLGVARADDYDSGSRAALAGRPPSRCSWCARRSTRRCPASWRRSGPPATPGC